MPQQRKTKGSGSGKSGSWSRGSGMTKEQSEALDAMVERKRKEDKKEDEQIMMSVAGGKKTPAL